MFMLYLLPNTINTLTIGNLQKVDDSEKNIINYYNIDMQISSDKYVFL